MFAADANRGLWGKAPLLSFSSVKFLHHSLCRCHGHRHRTHWLPLVWGSDIDSQLDRGSSEDMICFREWYYSQDILMQAHYWPGVVFLSPPLVRIGLVVAFIAQHVRGDVVDLDTGRMVQHLQVLKHCLTDLLQVLHQNTHTWLYRPHRGGTDSGSNIYRNYENTVTF